MQRNTQKRGRNNGNQSRGQQNYGRNPQYSGSSREGYRQDPSQEDAYGTGNTGFGFDYGQDFEGNQPDYGYQGRDRAYPRGDEGQYRRGGYRENDYQGRDYERSGFAGNYEGDMSSRDFGGYDESRRGYGGYGREAGMGQRRQQSAWGDNSGFGQGGYEDPADWQFARGRRDSTQQQQFDPDYSQWRDEQIRGLDNDYQNWRQERYGKFSSEFSEWRKNRESSKSDDNSSGNTGTTGNKDRNK